MSRNSPDFVEQTSGVRRFLTLMTLLIGLAVCPVTGTQSNDAGTADPEAFQQSPTHGSSLHALNRNAPDYYGQPQRYRPYKNYGYRRSVLDDGVSSRSSVRYVRQPTFVLHHRHRPTDQPPLIMLPPENQLSNLLQAEPAAVCSTSRCDTLPCCDGHCFSVLGTKLCVLLPNYRTGK